MANFHVQGIDGIAKGLELLGQKTGPMAEDMLHAGALILIGTWNRVIIARGHVETGAMMRSVKATKPKINKDGNLEIQVYPQGAERKEHRKKPVRNAEKAFVLHYADNIDAKLAQCRGILPAPGEGEGMVWSPYQSLLGRSVCRPVRTPSSAAETKASRQEKKEPRQEERQCSLL